MNYILTNGCFDLFHTGHAAYLQKLKELALQIDAELVVFVNSDSSVETLKGLGRPIIHYADRATMVNYWADRVCDVDEPDCVRSLQEFVDTLPSDTTFLYAKEAGGETGPEGQWARRLGIPILTFSRAEGVSTTEIIERIQSRVAKEAFATGQGRDADTEHRASAAFERSRLIAGGAAGAEETTRARLLPGDSYQPSSYRPGGIYGGSLASAGQEDPGDALGRGCGD